MLKMAADSKPLERALAGEQLTFDDGMELMSTDLHALGAVADAVRRRSVGDRVTFTSSYYMNYTNLCAASCQMCAFYRKEGAEDAYTLTPDQIEKRVAAAVQMGATEVHIVGGFHPSLPLDYYEEMMRAIKAKHPDLNIKAFTAAEIFYLSKLTKNPVREILARLRDAGLDTMPGGGAELFHPDVRSRIIRGKCTGQQWLDTIREAHNLGIRSNVTMLYGHIESPEHIIDHLVKTRDLQRGRRAVSSRSLPLKFSLGQHRAGTGKPGDRGVLGRLRPEGAGRLPADAGRGSGQHIGLLGGLRQEDGPGGPLIRGQRPGRDRLLRGDIPRRRQAHRLVHPRALASIVREIKRQPVQRNTLFGTVRNL